MGRLYLKVCCSSYVSPFRDEFDRSLLLIELAIILSFHSEKSDQIEGRLLKGKGKQIYYVVNQTKYGIPDGDTFEGLGFDWGDVWHLSDIEVNYFPDGGYIKSCDKKSCINSAFFEKKDIE